MADVAEEAATDSITTVKQEEGSVSEASNAPIVEETTFHTPEHSQTKNKRPPRRPAKDREGSKNRNFKQNDNGQNNTSNDGSKIDNDANDKEAEKQEGEDAAPKRPTEKPYRNPTRHLTGGAQRVCSSLFPHL